MNWKPWLHGLGSAFIGGGANSVGAMIIAPATFNLTDGLGKILSLWVVSGSISAALYLAKSPLPGLNSATGSSGTQG